MGVILGEGIFKGRTYTIIRKIPQKLISKILLLHYMKKHTRYKHKSSLYNSRAIEVCPIYESIHWGVPLKEDTYPEPLA